ncbi:hypothetical protein AVEN_29735-1 [Araneus ventricosus]|uniref:Uncharacterized protein n=1 Tax=Araneus ventricosus TaxID=182803 RepID=A0A4Y2PCX2_ARAVE|nr:hypothetical protein AVEN_29735-1 [Araneus ventricosus]
MALKVYRSTGRTRRSQHFDKIWHDDITQAQEETWCFGTIHQNSPLVLTSHISEDILSALDIPSYDSAYFQKEHCISAARKKQLQECTQHRRREAEKLAMRRLQYSGISDRESFIPGGADIARLLNDKLKYHQTSGMKRCCKTKILDSSGMEASIIKERFPKQYLDAGCQMHKTRSRRRQ